MMRALTNHLWQSTLFGLGVAVLILAFRNSRARVRFWLWLAASLKFLAPLALLLGLGSHLAPPPAAAKPIPPAASAAILQATEPFPENLPPAYSPQQQSNWIWIAALIWTCGFATLVLTRLRGYWRIRCAIRASRRAQISLPVEVRISPVLLEPGVFGLWRPILLLPEGIMERLTPEQFDAVIAHELCHVRRRDNLTASCHMLVEALFWFHPLVWWIGARLVEERERACDEAVLGLGGEPRDYAEGILSVYKSYLESPMRPFSGVTGSDLRKRIHKILTARIGRELNFTRKAVLAITAVLAFAAPMVVGVIRAQSSTRPQFEVASIKRCADSVTPGGRGGGPSQFTHDQMTLNCQSVAGLINAAYVLFASGGPVDALKVRRIPVEGGPAWISSERFTINAKAESDASAAAMQGPLLQTLLENRFKLKIHRETREIPVYELVVAKGGPKLRPFQPGGCTPLQLDLGKMASIPRLPAGQRYCNMGGGAKGPNFAVNAEGITLDDFANTFLRVDGRPVVNKTGIAGTFEIHFEFGIDDEARQRMTEITGKDPGEPTAAPVFTAIQEQLGLKLESAKGPGEFLVIDHVERPDEN